MQLDDLKVRLSPYNNLSMLWINSTPLFYILKEYGKSVYLFLFNFNVGNLEIKSILIMAQF